jgi:hypothetical protein
MKYEIAVEWFDRRKRTKDYTLQFATGKEASAWLEENANALYFKAMIWVSNLETNLGMEIGDMNGGYLFLD